MNKNAWYLWVGLGGAVICLVFSYFVFGCDLGGEDYGPRDYYSYTDALLINLIPLFLCIFLYFKERFWLGYVSSLVAWGVIFEQSSVHFIPASFAKFIYFGGLLLLSAPPWLKLFSKEKKSKALGFILTVLGLGLVITFLIFDSMTN